MIEQQISDDELNWAAGMFEGEGTIRISKDRRNGSYRLQCIVPNTDRQIVDFFHERWLGSNKPELQRANQRPQHRWVVSGKMAKAFLLKLEPHIRTDRGQKRVNVALRFQILKELYRNSPSDRPRYRDDQRECYETMRRLNARGAVAKTETQPELALPCVSDDLALSVEFEESN